MRYGYARTSTDDQTTALQLAALKKARCAHIFEDKGYTGATTKRPGLARCLKTLRAGDTLTVWKLDRLGRSLADFIVSGWIEPRHWRRQTGFLSVSIKRLKLSDLSLRRSQSPVV